MSIIRLIKSSKRLENRSLGPIPDKSQGESKFLGYRIST